MVTKLIRVMKPHTKKLLRFIQLFHPSFLRQLRAAAFLTGLFRGPVVSYPTSMEKRMEPRRFAG